MQSFSACKNMLAHVHLSQVNRDSATGQRHSDTNVIPGASDILIYITKHIWTVYKYD